MAGITQVVTVKSRQQGSPCIFTARIRVRRSGQLYCTLAKLASMSQPCDVHYRVTINVLLALLDDMLDAYVPAAQTTTRIVAEDLTPFCRVPLKVCYHSLTWQLIVKCDYYRWFTASHSSMHGIEGMAVGGGG